MLSLFVELHMPVVDTRADRGKIPQFREKAIHWIYPHDLTGTTPVPFPAIPLLWLVWMPKFRGAMYPLLTC